MGKLQEIDPKKNEAGLFLGTDWLWMEGRSSAVSVLVMMRRGIRFTEHNGEWKTHGIGRSRLQALCRTRRVPVVLGGSTKMDDPALLPNRELRPAAAGVSNNQP